jgi:hypothetical protein
MTKILTPHQLAKRWNVTIGSLTNQRSKGLGPVYVKLGEGKNSPVRYRLEDIEIYERNQLKGNV